MCLISGCATPPGVALKNQENFSQGSQLRASAPSARHMVGLSEWREEPRQSVAKIALDFGIRLLVTKH